MRTTVTLDDEIYEAALSLSRASGKRLGEVLSELARRGLRTAQPKRRSGRFPVFEVPPDAAMIPGSRAKAILDEEGLV